MSGENGWVPTGGDCDDSQPERAPGLDELCDGIDNDCNGDVDDGVTNVCGGTCEGGSPYVPDDPCDNGLLGACLRDGVYACAGGQLVCTAARIEPGIEMCGDGVDNDCDGQTDEGDAADATVWYRDCDGDGYPAEVDSVSACEEPVAAEGCDGWLTRNPQTSGLPGDDWDCDDASSVHHPLQSFHYLMLGETDFDLDCSGVVEVEEGLADVGRTFFENVCSASDQARIENGDCPFSPCFLWYDPDGTYRRTAPTPCVAAFDTNPGRSWERGWSGCKLHEVDSTYHPWSIQRCR